MSCEWPTSSCTFAVSASFRCRVGARRIHSRSGSTPISSEFPCISMNLMSFARESSGIQSAVSTCPPDWTYSRNACSRSLISTLTIVRVPHVGTRRNELTRQAARLFAEKGYHGTSIGDLADAMGVQKGSLYAHIDSKADLLWDVARDGAAAFHAALDGVDEALPVTEKIRLALRAHLRVVAEQLDIATVFIREWRYLEGDRREEFLAERRRYEDRFRSLYREGRELGELRTDLDDGTATLLALSAANWTYTWLKPGVDTDELADRFYDFLLDGMRGYVTPR